MVPEGEEQLAVLGLVDLDASSALEREPELRRP